MDVEQIDGVGPATKEKLNEAGISTAEDLAGAMKDELTDVGISERKAGKLQKRAGQETIAFQSGDEVEEEIEAKDYISTGMGDFDEMLGGGWRQGIIAGIAGKSSADDDKSAGGKTQLIFQSLVKAVEDTGDPAVYIETEREQYSHERLKQLSDDPDAYEDVWRISINSLEKQLDAYGAIKKKFDNVSMIAVDSLTAQMRLVEDYQDRTGFGDRTTMMARHLSEIDELVEYYDCPVLLALQAYGNPQRFGDSGVWGGSLLDHYVSFRIKIKPAQGTFRKAALRGHNSRPDNSVMLTIGGDGLSAHKEEP